IAFPAAVPRLVVVVAVLIPVSIGDVVLALVADEVVQRVAVVSRDEVDAAVVLVPEEVRTAEGSCCEPAGGAGLGAQERPAVVAEAAVPLTPGTTGEGIAELIRGEVPRLRDETHVAFGGERGDLVDELAVVLGLAVEVAPEDRAEVEPEPVD